MVPVYTLGYPITVNRPRVCLGGYRYIHWGILVPGTKPVCYIHVLYLLYVLWRYPITYTCTRPGIGGYRYVHWDTRVPGVPNLVMLIIYPGRYPCRYSGTSRVYT